MIFNKVLLLHIGFELCIAASIERMFVRMSRSSSSDLAPEATGYIYRSDNNGPVSYIKLGPDTVHKHLNTIRRTSPVIPEYPNPIFRDHTPSKVEYENYLKSLNNIESHQNEDTSEDDVSNEQEDNDDDYDDDNSNYDSDDDEDSDENEEYESSDSNSEEESSKGSKGDNGYKTYESSEEGAKGNHENAAERNNYEENGGVKSGKSESASNYNSNHAAANGYYGENFSQKKGHDRGSKTTGFHNVYHKDELKKNKEFYDKADNSGKFNTYENHKALGHSNEGGHVQGKKVDAAFDQGNYGNHHYLDKGSDKKYDQKYVAKNGHEQFYNNAQAYNAHGDKEKHRFSEGY